MSYALQGLGQTGTPDIAQWREDVALAHQAGIPVLALKAIQSNESHGHANVTRFEPRIFNDLTSGRFRSQFPSDTGSSGTGMAMPAAFSRAYALDPTNAVKATSWGTYQVLIRDAGPQIWTAAGSDPARFIQMFNADPPGISKRILVSWFHGRPPAQAAARAMNLVELAHRYNGCCVPPNCSATGRSCDRYAGGLRAAVDLWTPEWEQVRNLPEIAEAAAAATMRTVVANPISTLFIGTAVLGGAAAFAWWAYSQRKPKRNARRRRSSRRTSRNPSNGPVTLYAVDSNGRRRELGVARGRSQFVKLVKASVPIGTGSYLEVEGYGHALKDVGSSYGGSPMTISTPHGSVVVRGTPLAYRLP